MTDWTALVTVKSKEVVSVKTVSLKILQLLTAVRLRLKWPFCLFNPNLFLSNSKIIYCIGLLVLSFSKIQHNVVN